MNEQGCAFVCAIFCTLGMILSVYSLKTGDMSCWWVTLALGAVVVLLSGYVILCRYL